MAHPIDKCHLFKIVTSDKFWLAVIVLVFADVLKTEMVHRMLRWEKYICAISGLLIR